MVAQDRPPHPFLYTPEMYKRNFPHFCNCNYRYDHEDGCVLEVRLVVQTVTSSPSSHHIEKTPKPHFFFFSFLTSFNSVVAKMGYRWNTIRPVEGRTDGGVRSFVP